MLSGAVLAALPRSEAATVVRTGHGTTVGFGVLDVCAPRAEPDPGPEPGQATDPFASIDQLTDGWWAGTISYELGHSVEHVVLRQPTEPPARPVSLVRFAARVELGADGSTRWFGTGPERAALERALESPRRPTAPIPAGTWTSSLSRFEYEARVRTIQELIRAGECYQVNLTRRLTGPAIDPVALWATTEAGNPAPHSLFFRDDTDTAVVCASPERFLRVDGERVETRPIKGTAARAARLRTSEKDRAENVMIVDLARNDLGRVCIPGSISVPELCRVETHPGLVHLVSTVRGRRRAEVGLGGVLRATFPPASITGAPKPRVMQAIEDLEPVRRGVYCGAVGWIDADRSEADLAVAIRTFTCGPETTGFGVGAGITIDSDPGAEWNETELKAARLLALAGARTAAPAAAGQP